ncbi:MAG: hypothetical protein AB7D27_17345 [Desulfomicrobium sp.]
MALLMDDAPLGKTLVFRWTRKCPKTGKIIRAKHRPFPMWVDVEY